MSGKGHCYNDLFLLEYVSIISELKNFRVSIGCKILCSHI